MKTQPPKENNALGHGRRAIWRCIWFQSAVTIMLLGGILTGRAQTGPLTGPVFGYVFDQATGQLRSLRGIPGSATLGPAVESGRAISGAIALDARQLLISTKDSSELFRLDMGVSPPAVAAIPGVPAHPSVMAVSSRGTSAALSYPEGKVWILTGLPQKPIIAHALDLPISTTVTHMAVSDDGKSLVYAVDEGSGQGLYGWTAAASYPSLLMGANAIGAIALTEKGTAIVADRGSNEIFAVSRTEGGAIRQLLAGSADGVSNPVGVAVSGPDRILVANADTDTLITLDSSGRLIQVQHCGCDISAFQRVYDAVFRLTDRIDGTVFLVDASQPEARVTFVPNPESAQ